jgi:glycosyltransferase involved in cell wall biosynthesis
MEACKLFQVPFNVANPQEPPVQPTHLPQCGGQRMKGIFAENTAELPLVTVVTAVFNGEKDLASCLESVLAQDYPNIEHLILDGGSRDGTLDVLRQYDDRIALWKSAPDKGVFDAWNKGVAEARGEWICFLGSDDEFLPGAIRAYMALAASNPQAEYLSSQVRWTYPSGYVRIIGGPWTWAMYSKFMCVAHSGSMHRRSLLDRLGEYGPDYYIVQDYELLLRARDQLKAAYMPVNTVMMRAGGISDTSIALTETRRAKISTGRRSKALATIEFYIAHVKFALSPLRRAFAKSRT